MLSKKQLKCIKLMVDTDMQQKEIAEAIKVSEQTICTWKQNDDFKYEYEKYVKDSIDYSSKNAFRTILKLLKAKSEMVRLQAAKDILDRAGYKAKEKVEITGAIDNPYDELTVEELRALAKQCEKDG